MRGEVRDDIKAENIPEDVSLEKQQEMLLINKMAAGGKLPPKSQSVFLQKRLQQRVSIFINFFFLKVSNLKR